jgi:hypothetical protein
LLLLKTGGFSNSKYMMKRKNTLSPQEKEEKMKKLFMLCICLVTFIACAKPPQPEDFPQTIELQAGASKKISNDLSIRFNSVLEDSRCPTGVQCAWEGNAEILLELSGGSPATVHLNTGAQFPRTEIYNGHTITLQELSPYPAEGMHIDESRYTAILAIDLEKSEEPSTTQ